LYRLLSGLPLLVPVARAEEIDRNELNVFAAKPDRAAVLETAGVLIAGKGDWHPSAAHRALPLLTAQQFAPAFGSLWSGDIDADYHDALVAYEVWRSAEKALPQRWAALDDALAKMCSLCERAANFARLSTLARIAWEAGRRTICSRALSDFIGAMESRQVQIFEPFWPACARYDAIAPGAQAGLWFAASAIEQYERVRAYSSYFADDASLLDWLCQQPFASIEMQRRRVLMEARIKGKIEVPPRLLTVALDHFNAEVWRKGII
jgi:hypothetical protein